MLTGVKRGDDELEGRKKEVEDDRELCDAQ